MYSILSSIVESVTYVKCTLHIVKHPFSLVGVAPVILTFYS
jgi:hypothetical protein